MSLNSKKSTSGEISTKILQKSANICSFALKDCFTSCLDKTIFLESLKRATITPVLKEGNPTSVKNYRPISILPTVSKVFEKIIAQQLNPFLENCFFRFTVWLSKRTYSTQHALLRLLHLWQRALDDSNIVGTILMDLSKAYDCLPPDLLIAKLAAYGVNHNSLLFIYDYLINRYHRVKIGNSLSSFLSISMGVPQGSILGPILFNIFLNNLLLSDLEAELCNFADDNTLFAIAKALAEIIEIQDILYWGKINGLVANPGKFEVMFLGRFEPISTFNIGNIKVKVKNQVKLLGI
uniref:Reverse transcriptase domain-containing protein n=1 Tax=Clytia hemisphaerica TaxID=252671 RepID=A0A7M5WZM1_9CNID|eukprot:TCONS_00000625-protein